jgi:hypothetical protein
MVYRSTQFKSSKTSKKNTDVETMTISEEQDETDGEEVSIRDIEVSKDVKMTIPSQSFKTQLHNAGIVVISLIGFTLLALYTHYKGINNPVNSVTYFGPGIIVAKGCALAIYFLIIMIMFFVSYDVLTWMRTRCCGLRLLTLIDFSIVFHKFCGWLILFYSVLHTVMHLVYTFPAMVASNDNPGKRADLNEHVLTHHHFGDQKLTY